MILDKITKLGVAVAVLGLGILVACSDGDNNVASSFSETNTGKPVEKVGTLADLGASETRKLIEQNDLESCNSRAKKSHLAKEAFDADTNVTIGVAMACETIYALNMDTRAQVVDVEGKPVAGATVYKGSCDFDYERCRYVTDENGYFYMDGEMYLTLEPTGLNVEFETLQLHVLSADTSLGANVFSSFASADVVNVDGKQYAELKQIVLEPVYTAKLYFDSLFVEIDEKMNEEDKTDIEEFNHRLTEMIDGEDLVEICAEKEGGWPSANYYDNKEDVFHHYDEEEGAFPLHMYPCQKVTKEDYKNGYVVLFGLPEGKFQALVSGWWSYEKYFPQIVVKP